MADEVKIEKGIPMPPEHGGFRSKYPWHAMECGDSILVDRAPYQIAGLLSKRLAPKVFKGGKYAGGFRVWRIK